MEINSLIEFSYTFEKEIQLSFKVMESHSNPNSHFSVLIQGNVCLLFYSGSNEILQIGFRRFIWIYHQICNLDYLPF